MAGTWLSGIDWVRVEGQHNCYRGQNDGQQCHAMQAVFLIDAQIAQVAQPVLLKWATWSIWAAIKKCSLKITSRGLLFIANYTGKL